MLDDGTTPVSPITTAPVEPPPPPPPPPVLLEKPKEEQQKIVSEMTPEQVTAYEAEIAELPQAQQQEVANTLAQNLDAEALANIRPAFGDAPGGMNMVDQAVIAFAPAEVAGGYPAAVLAADPDLNQSLQDLGLTQDEIDAATTETIDVLGKAATLAESGDYAGALAQLKQLAQDGQQALADKALATIAGQIPNLPQEVQDILADPTAREQLLSAGTEVTNALLEGDLSGALAAIAKPELRDAVIDALLANPDSKFSKGVEALGLDAQDLKDAGNAAGDLFKAVQHAGREEWTQAGLALADAIEKAPDLSTEALQAIASKLPEPAASILGSDNVAELLAGATPELIRNLVEGKAVEALKSVAANEDLRNALIDAAIENDDDGSFAAALAKIGIDTGNEDDVNKLKQAGAGLPAMIEAAQLADSAKTPEDWKAVALKLVEASSHAPELVADGIQSLASNLEDPAKSIISDPAVAKELAEASPEALTALINGDPLTALKGLANDEGLRNAVIDAAIANDPGNKFRDALGRIGIDTNTPSDVQALKDAGDALPTLIDAIDLAANAETAEDWKNVGLKLAEAADQAPELVAQIIPTVAEKLPDGLAKTILTDPTVADQLADLGPEVLTSLLNGDPGAALSAIGDNKALRDAVIDAAVTDPKIAKLMADNGITAAMLKEAGDAAPHLFNAIRHLTEGDVPAALEAFKLAGESAPELLGKVGQALYDQLPEGTLKTLSDLGIDRAEIAEAAAALPHLIDAATSAGEGKWNEALQSLGEAAQAAPELAKSAIKSLAENLLPQVPPRKFLPTTRSWTNYWPIPTCREPSASCSAVIPTPC